MSSKTILPILFTISFIHLLNDAMQAVIPAIFPILYQNLGFSFTQLGLLGFANNITASLTQPFIGSYTDKKPIHFLLPLGMFFTLIGMLLLGVGTSFWSLIVAVMSVGLGSAIFHPESSRVVVLAAGLKRGLGQSIFQVGGNTGQAFAPLLTLWIFVPFGQKGALWFTLVAFFAIILLSWLAKWKKEHLKNNPKQEQKPLILSPERKKVVYSAMTIIMIITFVRTWYFAGITNFYAIFRIEVLGETMKEAQLIVFVFMLAAAIGTLLGGPLGDKLGNRNMLFFSVFFYAPFALVLPYSEGWFVYVCLIFTGVGLLASFSVSVVYAMMLLPGQVGKVSGMMFGLAFGLGALGALALGAISDTWNIEIMMQICSFIPLLSILAYFLPDEKKLATI